MICSRAPRIFQPAKYLFELMQRFSKAPRRVIASLDHQALQVRCARTRASSYLAILYRNASTHSRYRR